MAEAKIASLKRQRETEIALAQTAGMKAQLASVLAENTPPQSQLAESRSALDAWESKTAIADQEIDRLQRLPVEK